MNAPRRDPVRRPFLLALAASLLLHFLALTAPGWRLPWLEREPAAPPLDATLAALPAPAPPAAARPPPPRPKPRPPPAPAPATPESPRAVEPSPPERPLAPEPSPPPEAASPEPPPAPAEPSATVPPAPTFAATWPKRGLIRFEITRGEGGLLVGQSEHRWSHDGDSYELRALTETIGLAALFRPAAVSQESRGVFDAAGLRPVEFNARRDGKPRDSVRFDSGQRRIFLGNGGSAALAEGAQDLLSLFYQLGALPADAPGASLTVATGRKVESYAIIPLETLTLETPFGARSVRHLRLPGARGGDGGEAGESTEVWLDTATRLPLKIRHRDRKGEVFDQTATAVELESDE